MYGTLIAFVWRDYDAAYLFDCWFLFIRWGDVDIQIWALLTRSRCKVSYTQVTVKACEPLVDKFAKLTPDLTLSWILLDICVANKLADLTFYFS